MTPYRRVLYNGSRILMLLCPLLLSRLPIPSLPLLPLWIVFDISFLFLLSFFLSHFMPKLKKKNIFCLKQESLMLGHRHVMKRMQRSVSLCERISIFTCLPNFQLSSEIFSRRKKPEKAVSDIAAVTSAKHAHENKREVLILLSVATILMHQLISADEKALIQSGHQQMCEWVSDGESPQPGGDPIAQLPSPLICSDDLKTLS